MKNYPLTLILLFLVVFNIKLSAQEEEQQPIAPVRAPVEMNEEIPEAPLDSMRIDSMRIAKARTAKIRAEEERRERYKSEIPTRRRDNNYNVIDGLFNTTTSNHNQSRPGNAGEMEMPSVELRDSVNQVSGIVGGNLWNRQADKTPEIEYQGQETGKVVVVMCVAADGFVIQESVKVTLRGATTSSPQLRNAAIENAKQWHFESSELDRQCGTIIYTFVVEE